jgi:hypothetical protein
MKLRATTLHAVLVAAAVTSPAMAEARCSSGFLANLGCALGVIDKPTANALDKAHANMGSPLDAVPGTVLSGLHPSLGAAYDMNQMMIGNRPPLAGPRAFPGMPHIGPAGALPGMRAPWPPR